MSAVDLFECCFWECAASLSAVEDNYSMCVCQQRDTHVGEWGQQFICLFPPLSQKLQLLCCFTTRQSHWSWCFSTFSTWTAAATSYIPLKPHPLPTPECWEGNWLFVIYYIIFGCSLPSNLPGISETRTSASVNWSTLRCLCSSCWQRRKKKTKKRNVITVLLNTGGKYSCLAGFNQTCWLKRIKESQQPWQHFSDWCL